MTANDLGGKSETAGEGSVENGGGDVQVVESPTVPAPTSVDLDAIRARCEAATPGPWEADGSEITSIAPGNYRWVAETCVWDDDVATRANSAFIAHARTDLPAALDEIDRLRINLDHSSDVPALLAEVDRLQELVDEDKAAYDELAERMANLERATGERSNGI